MSAPCWAAGERALGQAQDPRITPVQRRARLIAQQLPEKGREGEVSERQGTTQRERKARPGLDASSAFFQAAPGPRPEQWFKIAAAAEASESGPPALHPANVCLAVNAVVAEAAAATKSSPSSSKSASEPVPYQSPEPFLPRTQRLSQPFLAASSPHPPAAVPVLPTPRCNYFRLSRSARHLLVAADAAAARRRRRLLLLLVVPPCYRVCSWLRPEGE
ncbi:hypothetical protein HPB50_022211 [Hyalomma asiaticum]|uniref:Uncharacterized protein n=1 Tax=Hyalomma asiaticum TaxID=266040 RepID=A0ACB7SAW7_HYAAI|nr:hypothetical protein HPB50_022211 [Hyalomma asiaticum]